MYYLFIYLIFYFILFFYFLGGRGLFFCSFLLLLLGCVWGLLFLVGFLVVVG